MLDHWLTLWHWTRLLDKQLVGYQVEAAFTYQKQRLDLWLTHGPSEVQLTWMPYKNQTTFYLPGRLGRPRRRVAIFTKELNYGDAITSIALHPELPVVRFKLEADAELIYDFRHPRGNVYYRRQGEVISQFIKSVPWRALEDNWYPALRLKTDILTGRLTSPLRSKDIPLLEPFHFDRLGWLINHYQISDSEIEPNPDNLPDLVRLIVRHSRINKSDVGVDSIQKRARTVLKRWRRKFTKQQAELAANDWQKVQQQADGLAIAAASRLKPASTGPITLPSDLSPTGSELTIPLDPKQSLHQNLQHLYQSVRKIKSRAADHAHRLKQTELDIKILAALLRSGQEQNLQKFLEEHGERFTGDAKASPVRIPYRSFMSHAGFPILVGRSARDNDTLTFKVAGKNDWWFHARGVTGSHVILQTGKQEPRQRDLVLAAQLAARYSDAKHSGVAPVSYCQRKYLSKPRGAAPGTVRLLREEVLTVEPYRLEGES